MHGLPPSRQQTGDAANIHRLPGGLLEDEPPFVGKEDEGLSCHYRLVFSLIVCVCVCVFSAACQLLAHVQFLGIAVFRLLYSVACFLAHFVFFFFVIWCLSTYFRLHWKLNLPFLIAPACLLAPLEGGPIRIKKKAQ